MMPIYLPPTVERPTGTNQAGGCYIQLVPATQIATMPDEVRGTVPTDITLVEGAAWITLQPTLWTQEFRDEWVTVGGAQHSRALLELVVPKDREELLYGLWQLHGGRFVAIHYDRNKTAKLIGTKDEPAMVRMVRLEHGQRPGAGRNQYLLQVSVSRRTPCPFYLGTPPEIIEPTECNLVEMLSTTPASTIATALESAGVLAAVQALICETCPSLCQRLDDAIILGGGAEFLGVNVVLNLQSGTIPATGTTNGKPSGSTTDFPSGFAEFLWNGSAWMVSDGFSTWTSTEDVATPGEVTTWSGSAPLPTVEDSFGGGGDASAVVDCLSPEQAAVLAEALGAVGGGTVTIRTTADDATVTEVEAPDTVLLPQTSIEYLDEAGDAQVLAPVNTGFSAGILRPATVLARFTVMAGDGITPVVRGSVAYPTVNLPDSTIKYRNTSNVLVETTPATTQFNGISLKPATEVPRRAARNTAGTGFFFITLADLLDDSVQQMPDGTVSSAASTPLFTAAVPSGAGIVLSPVQIVRGSGTTQDVEYRPNTTSPVFTEVNRLDFLFDLADGQTLAATVDSTTAGTYTVLTSDGASGTLTFSKNGGSFAAIGAGITLAAGDTIRARRTVTTASGWVRIATA